MKLKLLFTFVLITFISFSQEDLVVKNGSYMYVDNTVLFVTDDVNIEGSADLYLRNESQLIQENDIKNIGDGDLSVYQTGTKGAYEYNYWASPVGASTGPRANTDFSMSLMNDPDRTPADADRDTGFTAMNPASLALYDVNGTADPLVISPYWIYAYYSGTAYSSWQHIGDTGALTAGYGFTMKGVDGTSPNNPGSAQKIDFKGRPNTGDIVLPITAAEETLIGNPYPSSIDLVHFLLDNSGASDCDGSGGTDNVITGTAYFWDQVGNGTHMLSGYSGGYGTFTGAGGCASTGTYTAAPIETWDNTGDVVLTTGPGGTATANRKFSPIGQGFMVMGSNTANLTMKNSYRAYYPQSGADSQFERSSGRTIQEEIKPKYTGYSKIYEEMDVVRPATIRINAIVNDEYSRELAIVHDDDATIGYDSGRDGKANSDASPKDLLFDLNDEAFVINAVSFNENLKLPLILFADEATNYNIRIKSFNDWTYTQDVFIHDIENDYYYDIVNGSFDIVLEEGEHRNKFEIVFKKEVSEVVINEEELNNSFIVYQNNSNSILTVENPDLYNISSVKLFDTRGRIIFDRNSLEHTYFYTFSTSDLSDGVYLVNITTENNGVITRKVSINN